MHGIYFASGPGLHDVLSPLQGSRTNQNFTIADVLTVRVCVLQRVGLIADITQSGQFTKKHFRIF